MSQVGKIHILSYNTKTLLVIHNIWEKELLHWAQNKNHDTHTRQKSDLLQRKSCLLQRKSEVNFYHIPSLEAGYMIL